MSWNYRIFQHREAGGTTFALHEAYYDTAGRLDGWTLNPVSPHADSVEELISILVMQLRDATRSQRDVLDYNSERGAVIPREDRTRRQG